MKKKIIISITVLILILSATILIGINEKNFHNIKVQYKNFFTNKDTIKENIQIKQIKTLKDKTTRIIGHKDEKKRINKAIDDAIKFIDLKNTIIKNFDNNIMKSTVTKQDIENFKIESKKLSKNYRENINEYIYSMEEQRTKIDNIEKKISSLYKEHEQFKDDLTKEEINNYKQELSFIPQVDIVNKNIEILNSAASEIEKRQEEERKKQEEEERKRKEQIKNAWVIINVPYISQNKNGVYNGCEAASLLMGLKYKGFLNNMTINQYAIEMPKSENNNAYEGFTHDIFGLEPRAIPHWIAPNALANFGRISSGNNNVIDGTGMSLDQLDQELENNNPVVIYATARFEQPKEWIEGAPKNIHVLLLTGYNRITKEQLIIDPWTYNDGKTSWTLSKSLVEQRYNDVGKKSVIIR